MSYTETKRFSLFSKFFFDFFFSLYFLFPLLLFFVVYFVLLFFFTLFCSISLKLYKKYDEISKVSKARFQNMNQYFRRKKTSVKRRDKGHGDVNDLISCCVNTKYETFANKKNRKRQIFRFFCKTSF
jgi:hypothetical protein